MNFAARSIRFCLLSAMVLCLVTCSGRSGSSVGTGVTASVESSTVQGADSAKSPITIRILSTNDIHGSLGSSMVDGAAGPGRLGGVEYLAGLIASLRQPAPERTIVVDAGDCFQGDYAVNKSEGAFCTDFFNLVGYSVRTIGNHEFDYLDVGPDNEINDPRGALKRMIANSRHPIVLANVREKAGDPLHPAIREYVILDVSGVRIGITGVLTPDTPSVSRRAGSVGVEFEQPVDALRRVIPKMRSEGAGVVLVLSHLTGNCTDGRDLFATGAAACDVGGELSRIQAAFTNQDIDLIVSGHDHVMLRGDGRSIPIVENPGHGIVVGNAEIDVDPATGRRVGAVRVLEHVPVCIPGEPVPKVCSSEWPGFRGVAVPNESVRQLRLSVEAAVASECADIVATAATDITFSRTTEPPLANLAVDLLRELGTVVDSSGKAVLADFAFMNRGSTRASMAAGPVSVCDVARIWPFSDPPVLVSMTGAEIARMLTFLVDDVKKAPVISGMKVSRVAGGPIEIRDAGGTVIDSNKQYRVVTTQYMVEGGDRLDEFFATFPAGRVQPLPFDSYRDGFIKAIRARGVLNAPDTSRYSGITRD
ncbi:MAG TPA: bifunctional UDP-sugar hydrolase/5'-nucleotidase [Myxococcota bacterium]|nr:bifunctional UDP-sugar hydrolase/5'-nucleotidase [Myxococcota bacterium]